ncbi:MAG TPA: radical SAM protein [Silvibacterium sp.]|jgi:pyruvate-formate lyase-activating enzyme|nr:radical SAM protein [Silvibacterium sp.]
MASIAFRRTARQWKRLYREVRLVALALKSSIHPVFAHIVVTRRCNLACTYCSEFDNFSKPVPIDEMLRRIDRLAALGTTAVTLTGGETLLHPQLEEIIERVRSHGMLVVMITNGYLLTVDRIQRLNRAGLDRMQISIDNVQPDEVSKKSLKVLDQKLQWLSQHAEFPVHIHSVVGAGTDRPEDALVIARRATELGLGSSAGIVHDETGRMQALGPRAKKVIEDIENLSKPLFSFARHNPWRRNLLEGRPNDWHCPAGGRHLYICENGLVHYCMAQRGYPAIPLHEYTQEDMDRESKAPKPCAPYCTIFCVHRVALLDKLRENPREALVQLFPAAGQDSQEARPPLPIRALTSLLAPSRSSRSGQFFRKVAERMLNIN